MTYVRTAPRRRDPMAAALGMVTRIAGSPLLDRYRLRPRAERAAFHLTRTGMRSAAAVSRTFAAGRSAGQAVAGSPQRQNGAKPADLIDLTPTPDQQLILDVVRDVATHQLRPAADAADRAGRTPDDLLATVVELGVLQLGVPESLGGFSAERSPLTGVLVTEALAHGDLGLAVGCLAPGAVATALALWGDADQQATYLPAFVGATPPRAALAIVEPRAVFDPFRLSTVARVAPGGGYQLDGVKALVPAAARAELFVVAADLDGRPTLFLIESGTPGLTVSPEPAMGLRAAETGRLHLDGVHLPGHARLGAARAELGGQSRDGLGAGGASDPYLECIRLSRIAWCALAVGTAQAVVDYVIPYVNSREAFGEPVSHRQGVAFPVADMATELAGMRLATYRAASRAEQGLDYRREGALARRLCTDYGMAIGSDGVQLLGGHGFVREHPVERWYRDLRAVAVMEGVVLA